jgi:hypothetical protein
LQKPPIVVPVVCRAFVIWAGVMVGTFKTLTEQTRDYPVAYCHDGSEWATLLWDVVKEQWLDNEGMQFRINLAGRRRLAELSAMSAATLQPKESAVSIVPEHFGRYQAEADEFLKGGAFESSVFVMMKFPAEELPAATNGTLAPRRSAVPIRAASRANAARTGARPASGRR